MLLRLRGSLRLPRMAFGRWRKSISTARDNQCQFHLITITKNKSIHLEARVGPLRVVIACLFLHKAQAKVTNTCKRIEPKSTTIWLSNLALDKEPCPVVVLAKKSASFSQFFLVSEWSQFHSRSQYRSIKPLDGQPMCKGQPQLLRVRAALKCAMNACKDLTDGCHLQGRP